MVYIAYQYPDYGFYPENAQYINTPHACHRTASNARGLDFRQESMWPAGSTTPMTYSAWAAALAAAGTKMIRLIWGGRHQPWTNAYNLEPPPHGTYNVWHSALDDSNLTTFRSQQVSGSPGDPSFPTAYWTGSNIKQCFDACEANGIEVIVELSHNAEFDTYWTYNPWNYNNRYMNGSYCAAVDKGFLSDKRDFFTDSQAIQAMKDRIDFVIDLIGGYSCVCMWGIMSEGVWLFTAPFWGEPGYNSTVIGYIRNNIVPWYQTIAGYIRQQDTYNRPIMTSVAPTVSTSSIPSDPDAWFNVMMEPLMAYPVDIVTTNLYQSSFENKVKQVNFIREKVHPKQVMIHQYWPEGWTTGLPTLMTEYAPYTLSKRVEWIGAVLKWSTGPGRWMGLVEGPVKHSWTKGGYADADWYSIGSVTSTFRSNINWKNWSGAQDWSGDISSTGLDYSITTGDGDHFCGLLVYTSGGAKTLTITGVTDGAWTFKEFDWTDGSLSATTNPTASSNSVDVSLTTSTYNQTVVLGSKD